MLKNLPSVPKSKRAVMCLSEKRKKKHVLGEFHSGLSYRAVGCEFSVNESTKYVK